MMRRPILARLAGSVAGILAVLWILGGALPAGAKVYYAREEALQLAFPEVDRVEARDFILSQEQHERIEKLSRTPLESDLVTVYVGWKSEQPTAYAIFDTHTVRTYPETFLVVISGKGEVQGTHVLAFHEPEEYLPTPRWMDLFKGRRLDDDLQLGKGIAAISGSTLSTRAVTSGVRRALAIWQVVLGGK